MQHALRRWQAIVRSLIFNASLGRALIEPLLLNLILGAGVLLLDVSPYVKRQALFFFVQPIGGLWYSLRLRQVRGPWWQQAIGEGLLTGVVSVVLVVVPAVLTPFIAQSEQASDPLANLEIGLVFDLLRSIVAIAILRSTLRLWMLWDRLRRQRMIWALTHAHLTVVVLVALIFVVLITANVFSSNATAQIALEQPSPTSSLLARVFVGVLPILGVLIVLSVMALMAVLPPSALFSYLFARRTTHRLEQLARATSALRAGNYAARVEVTGEDEVARLQADFNAMAGELEYTLTDLKVERDKVAALLQSRRQLIASVSHELRTPVATLRGYLESTLSHKDDLAPGLCHDLAVMDRETLRLQNLIEDFFTLARTEAGGLALQVQLVDVNVIVRRCVDAIMLPAWQTGKVEVLAETGDSIPKARADEGRLEQIIYNLLNNAIRHTPPGGIVAAVTLTEPGMVVLQVRDTGEGITAHDLLHIWERFYRAESARSHDTSGAGLGLALVKELTEAMGGSVAVESDPGRGSCFTVRLPAG